MPPPGERRSRSSSILPFSSFIVFFIKFFTSHLFLFCLIFLTHFYILFLLSCFTYFFIFSIEIDFLYCSFFYLQSWVGKFEHFQLSRANTLSCWLRFQYGPIDTDHKYLGPQRNARRLSPLSDLCYMTISLGFSPTTTFVLTLFSRCFLSSLSFLFLSVVRNHSLLVPRMNSGGAADMAMWRHSKDSPSPPPLVSFFCTRIVPVFERYVGDCSSFSGRAFLKIKS